MGLLDKIKKKVKNNDNKAELLNIENTNTIELLLMMKKI